MVRIIILIAATIFLLAVTLVAHKARRPWAWARFLTFELCVILILLNAPVWFHNPFSPLQLISWLLLAISIFLALAGFILLQSRGKPDGHFERTTRLVATGTYKYIRHPMYASLFFISWGAFLKDMTLLTVLIVLASTAAALATARIEEKDCLIKFGEEYRAYMEKTKRFIPFVF